MRDGERGGWLSVRSDLVAVVEVRSEGTLQHGVLRSITGRGALIQMRTPPPLGQSVQVTFRGDEESADAAEDFRLEGYVQHAMAWSRVAGGLRAVAVRWGARPVSYPAVDH